MLSKIEREEKIIQTIKGNPMIANHVCKIVTEKKWMSRQTFWDYFRRMKKEGKINIYQSNGRNYLYLEEDMNLLRKRSNIFLELDDKDKLESRREHTKILKEKVIEPWLEQLPSIVDLKCKYPKGGLLVIGEPLFKDFKKHIKFEPDPYDELTKYTKAESNFNKKTKTIRALITENIISKELKKSPTSFVDEYNKTTNDLCEWIVGKLVDLHTLINNKETFNKFHSDFPSCVKETAGSYTYHVGDNDINSGSLPKEEMSKDKFKASMDEIIKKILRQVKKSEQIKVEILSLSGIQYKMSKHLANMQKSLQRHSNLEILPNDCEYYHWVPSK